MRSSASVHPFRYGLRLFGYQLFIFVAGGLAVVIGIGLVEYNAILAAVVILTGLAAVSGGLLATLYLVIVDAIEAGRQEN